ncbi:MAG TPA: hypothetical protein VF857_01005, partial [Spirochaetota bacterium]
CYAPSVAATDTDDLVFFWYDNREGINRIFTRRYGVNDNRFSKEISLSEGKEASRKPYGAVIGRQLFVVWEQARRIYGKFSDITVDAPRIFSKTHPEGKWVKNGDAVIFWDTPKDESGIVGYATLLSPDPDTNPTVQNLGANTRSETIRSLGDGITYYHIRAIDGAGNFSRTIHYPLRVSRNPLSLPIIESTTHPERKGVPNNSPQFTWDIADIERVKGFLYSVSKNVPGKPDIFTDHMSLSLSGLSEGRYFLRVQGIDKTNTPGRIADYEFIVGRAEKIDPTQYQKYAEGESEGEVTVPIKTVVRREFPSIEILPFAEKVLSDSVDLFVKAKTPKGYSFDHTTYELYSGGLLVGKGASGGGKISIKSLSDGAYRLTLRGIFTGKNGKRYETKPVEARFEVRVPGEESPLLIVMRQLLSGAESKILVLFIFFPFLAISIFIISSGRVLFYLHELSARLYSRLRVIISAISVSQ